MKHSWLIGMTLSLTLSGGSAVGSVFNPETFTLDNGMEVVVVSNHRAPVVSHWVWYRVGNADSPPGKSGLPHFLEHLMFKGTNDIPPGEFSKIVARNGGSDNAVTSLDFTAYFQNIARDRLELVMGMEADRMVNLTLTDNEVLPERDVVIEERRSRVENEPSALLGEQLTAAQFLHHPYRLPVIGWMHEMEQYDLESALEFYRTWYAPNNAILIVAGDITAEELRPMAERTYGQVAAREVPERIRLSEPPQLAARRLEMSHDRVQQPSVSRSYLAPSFNTEDKTIPYALDVLAELFGSGGTSRLYRSLVVEQGLAAAAGGFYRGTSLDMTSFRLYATPRPGTDLDLVEEALDQEIAKLLDEGVTVEELERVKKRMLAQAVYARDSLSDSIRAFGAALTAGLTVDDVESWPERIAAVTVEQVQAAAELVFNPAQSVTARLLPKTEGVEEIMHRRFYASFQFGLVAIAGLMTAAVAAPIAKAATVQEIVSDRGIKAYLVNEPSIPLISVSFQFAGGATTDPDGKEGRAYMIAGLLDEGAGEYDSQAFRRELEDNAIRLSFDADRDNFSGRLTTLTENAEHSFELLRLALTEARLDEEPIERIRNQIKASLSRRQSDPDYISARDWFSRAFPDHPYGRPTRGTIETIATLSAEDFRAFIDERLALDNLIIGVAGDIEPEVLKRLLDQTFGALPATSAPLVVEDVTPVIGDTNVIELDIPQSVVIFGTQGVARDHPDYYAAYVANYILGGGGFGSRLMEEVREKRGLAYSVYSYLFQADHASMMLGGVSTRNEQVGQSIEIIRHEIDKMARGEISEEALKNAKLYLTGSFPLRLTSNNSIAGILVAMQAEELGINYLDERNGYIEAVTLDDVKRAAALVFSNPLSLSVVGKPVGLDG